MMLGWALLLAAPDAQKIYQLPEHTRAVNVVRFGAHVAIVAKQKEGEATRQFVVFDGQRQETFDRIYDAAFSADGHFRYVGGNKDKNRVVYDGRAEAPYTSLSPVVGGGGHHCYNGFSGDAWYVVIDGAPKKLDG